MSNARSTTSAALDLFFCCYFAYKVEISGGQACPIIPLLIKKWHVPRATIDIYGPDKGRPFLQASG